MPPNIVKFDLVGIKYLILSYFSPTYSTTLLLINDYLQISITMYLLKYIVRFKY